MKSLPVSQYAALMNIMNRCLRFCRNHARHLERFPNVRFSAVCDLALDKAQSRIKEKIGGGKMAVTLQLPSTISMAPCQACCNQRVPDTDVQQLPISDLAS